MNEPHVHLQTKIIWSIESEMLNQNLAEQVATTNINALRIIYAKDREDQVSEFIHLIQKMRAPVLPKIPIMLDVSNRARGQIMRFHCPAVMEFGQEVTLIPDGGTGATKGDIEVRTSYWKDLFRENVEVYLGFGAIVLNVLRIKDDKVTAQVKQGGVLQEGIDVHVPETRKNPTLFDLSFVKLEKLKNSGIDFVLLPGISLGRELDVIRKRIHAFEGNKPWLIVRIDNKDAYDNLDEILDATHGVMISRRELALTMKSTQVPMMTKEIIFKCNNKAKLAIVESEMLASMRYNPTPTRAEVSDIANAVIDGTDAVVISEEIARGNYARRALNLCYSIIKDIEQKGGIDINWHRKELSISNEMDAVSFQAIKTAERVKAKAIVCITQHGNTALRLASFRVSSPVIAVTFSEEVQRQLALVRGVTAIALNSDPNLDQILPDIREHLKKYSWLNAEDRIVLVTVTISSIGYEASNLFTVQKLG